MRIRSTWAAAEASCLVRRSGVLVFTRDWFFDLERELKEQRLDSDQDSFDEIKSRLSKHEPVDADEFARRAVYVVLAGGFSQKTAKIIHNKIMNYLQLTIDNGQLTADGLFKIFRNRNKVNACADIFKNREKYRDGYYSISGGLDQKLRYLSGLPHIGKITANHLARNLGEDIVKYDVWIKRLGALFTSTGNDIERCDAMFAHMVNVTGLPRGYIDVVLWKACQNHMIDGL